MAQVTRTVAQGILDGQGYTDNEVRQLAHHFLAAPEQAAPAGDGFYEAINEMDDLYPTTPQQEVQEPVQWTSGPNLFKDWCAQWFGPDSDDDYLAKAVFALPPMAQRFAQPAPSGDAEDTAMLDWLDQNIFHREMNEWDAKYGGRGDQNMWVLFAPKGVQGTARNIINAALKEGK